MGGNVSKDKSSSDIVNEFVTSVVTNVTNNKTTMVEVSQNMDIGCSDSAFNKALEMCANAIATRDQNKTEVLKAYIAAGKDPSDDLIKSFNEKPLACKACSYSNIGQTAVMTISQQDIADNSIAGKIQSDLASKLDATKTTLQNEGFSKNQSIDESIKTIKNKIQSDVTTNVINSTLSSFIIKQDLKLGNAMEATQISQNAAVDFISASLIENVVEGDATVKAAVETLMPKVTTQKSIASNTTDMVGSVANNAIDAVSEISTGAMGMIKGLASSWIVFALVGFIIFAYLASKFLGGGGGSALMQGNFNPMQMMNPMQRPMNPVRPFGPMSSFQRPMNPIRPFGPMSSFQRPMNPIRPFGPMSPINTQRSKAVTSL